MIIKYLKILGFIFVLASCAKPPQPVWSKPGASENDFSKDKYKCMQQSVKSASSQQVLQSPERGPYDYDFGTKAVNELIAKENIITTKEFFGACMNAEGWYLKAPQAAVQ